MNNRRAKAHPTIIMEDYNDEQRYMLFGIEQLKIEEENSDVSI